MFDYCAYEELLNELNDDETVEALVFGDWGWDGFREPEPPPVPPHMRGRKLTLAEAEPFMRTWRFHGGYGSPECYAFYAWTNQRVFWVTQYDGSTSLDSAPRHPTSTMPAMPGV